MIQDIQPHVYHNEYTPRPAEPKDIVFVFRKNEVLAGSDAEGNLHFPRASEASGKLQYLFSIDDTGFFLGEEPVEGFEFVNLRALRSCKPAELCFAGTTAWHLYHWYTHHRFCGVCGKPVRHHEKLRALVCPECGNEIFPVIAPAVIVAVTHGDQILVEEAGVRVKNLRYFDSQPWGFASNLLLGYFAELDGSPEIHMDEEELQEARWVKRGELPVQENLASLTATMIEHFRQGNL